MNALAIRPLAPPAAPFGLRTDLVQLHQVLAELEHGHTADRGLDAAIYEALGWEVWRGRGRRRLGWRCRSPLALGWEPLPSPTGDTDTAARLRPEGWNWGVRAIGGKATGWCTHPRDEARFSEANRLSPARAVATACLFARRIVAMGGLRHG